MHAYSSDEYIILENSHFRLVVDHYARAESLVHLPSGRQCLQPGVRLPLFSVTQERLYNNELKLAYPTRRSLFPSDSIRLEGSNLIVGFERIPYEAVIAFSVADRYISFTLRDFIVKPDGYKGLKMNTPPTAALRLMQLPIADRGRFGHWLNVSFDDIAVNVLATSPHTLIDGEAKTGYHIMTADALRDIRLKGAGAALIVSQTDQLLDAIESVEKDYNLPLGVKSRRGPWINASVYWTSDANPSNIDTHISYAKQGGFRMMLFYYSAFVRERNSWSLCGNYELKEEFPNGFQDIRDMLQKVKDAGITPGLHFLHTHIGLQSQYATPIADHRLHLSRPFTLAKSASQTDTVLYVDQNPEGAALADGCRILRFGGEQIAYEAYCTEYPYCFTGCVRGHNGTVVTDHPRGTAGGVLDVSEFCATSVYIDQQTDLQDEISDKIARLYHAGFEFAYFDGSEGTNAPFEFHVPNAQYRVYQKLHNPPLFAEGAAKSHFSWHMLSGGNAFDIFPTPIFKEKIIEHPFEQAPRMANDFTRVNFGWWQFYPDTQPDTYEFGTSRAAAWDCPATVKGHPDRFAANPRTDDILEVMRRWEDIRAKNLLTPSQKEMLKDPTTEHILLINEAGEYELVPYCQIPAAADDSRVRAFVFERAGARYAVCWHATGEGSLQIPLQPEQFVYTDELGMPALPVTEVIGGTLIPLSRRRYLKTDCSMAQLTQSLLAAKLTD